LEFPAPRQEDFRKDDIRNYKAEDKAIIFFNVWLLLPLAGLWSYPPISFEAIPGHPF
jgi:hypothetical protein